MQSHWDLRILDAGSNWSITRISSPKELFWRVTYSTGQLTIGPYIKGEHITIYPTFNGIIVEGKTFSDTKIEIQNNGNIIIFADMYLGTHVIPENVIEALLDAIEKFNKSCDIINEISHCPVNISRSKSDNGLV